MKILTVLKVSFLVFVCWYMFLMVSNVQHIAKINKTSDREYLGSVLQMQSIDTLKSNKTAANSLTINTDNTTKNLGIENIDAESALASAQTQTVIKSDIWQRHQAATESTKKKNNSTFPIVGIGSIVSYFYDDDYQWLQAKLLDIAGDKLKLLFSIDCKVEEMDYKLDRLKVNSLGNNSDNEKGQGRFERCYETRNCSTWNGNRTGSFSARLDRGFNFVGPKLMWNHSYKKYVDDHSKIIAIRDDDGNWTHRVEYNKWDMNSSLIDESFEIRSGRSQGQPTKNQTRIRYNNQESIVFIRLRKTGSTSLMRYLQSVENLYPMYQLFRGVDHVRGIGEKSLSCFFGRSDYCPINNGQLVARDCSHSHYVDLIQHWTKALDSSNTTTNPLRMLLHRLTIVREPFDKLVSYFHYYRRIYPGWKNELTPAQEASVMVHNNLTQFMELLNIEGGVHQYDSGVYDIPNQYRQLGETPDIAISLIEGDSPRILALVTECFDASLMLLQELKPQFFTTRSVQKFLKSNTTKSNIRRKKGNHTAAGMGNKTSNNNDETLLSEHLRAKAKIWFKQDYTFYHAALHQFRRLLSHSSLPRNVTESCYQRLDQLLMQS